MPKNKKAAVENVDIPAMEFIAPATSDPDVMLSPEEADAAQDAVNAETAPDLVTAPPERLIEVWERRYNNPGASSSVPVQLTVPGMTVRWINTMIEGRYHRAVYEQGWQPVPVKLLADPQTIPDLYKHPHGIVCRGERGKEVLMMMPKNVYERIQARKAELTLKSLRNIRTEIAQAAAQKFGPEAGDFIHDGRTRDGNVKTVGSVQFGTESVPMGER